MSEVILLYDQNHSDGIRNFNEIGNEALDIRDGCRNETMLDVQWIKVFYQDKTK